MERKFLHVTIQEREQDEKDDTMEDQPETRGRTILLRGESRGVGESVGGR